LRVFDFSGKGGDVERQPTARLPPLPLQPAARIPGLGIFNRRPPGGISALDLGVVIIAWLLLLPLLFYFYFFKPKGERHIHTKLWDLFNMILANAFCLFFFLGEEFYEASPYEPVTSRLSDIFRLASIFSGTGADPVVSAKSNHCLDAAKACNLNDNCKKLRSSYISICNREISPTERCNRRKCHKALRQFFDRVPSEYTYRMLFCSCQDQACAERRRQTILPSCSYEDKEKPNCLDLRSLCRTDHLCRSRLADFHANCRASYRTITSCPADNYQACLGSYAGMIGFDMTPNYVDSNPTGIVVSPWCNCRGSGNMEEECEKFLKDFTENPCLRNAIQAFGNGTDVNMSPKGPTFSATQAPRVEKTPSLPDDLSDSTSLGTSVITTCTSIQEQGLKANNSKELSMCFTELTTNISPGSKKVIKLYSGSCRARLSTALTALPLLMVTLAQ
ncbi:glial cell line derived neurotrophic factor family receptor alpha 2, isoform CRA_a, partial [Mus musculus]